MLFLNNLTLNHDGFSNITVPTNYNLKKLKITSKNRNRIQNLSFKIENEKERRKIMILKSTNSLSKNEYSNADDCTIPMLYKQKY